MTGGRFVSRLLDHGRSTFITGAHMVYYLEYVPKEGVHREDQALAPSIHTGGGYKVDAAVLRSLVFPPCDSFISTHSGV